jgi:hypothetical protein
LANTPCNVKRRPRPARPHQTQRTNTSYTERIPTAPQAASQTMARSVFIRVHLRSNPFPRPPHIPAAGITPCNLGTRRKPGHRPMHAGAHRCQWRAAPRRLQPAVPSCWRGQHPLHRERLTPLGTRFRPCRPAITTP